MAGAGVGRFTRPDSGEVVRIQPAVPASGEEIVRIRLGFRRADAEFAEVDARGPASLRRSWNLKDSVAWLADPKWATLLNATVVPPVLAGEE
jgi:hypothetical protein